MPTGMADLAAVRMVRSPERQRNGTLAEWYEQVMLL
jgi:hypothetical protein